MVIESKKFTQFMNNKFTNFEFDDIVTVEVILTLILMMVFV
jgi:hypothetical protein